MKIRTMIISLSVILLFGCTSNKEQLSEPEKKDFVIEQTGQDKQDKVTSNNEIANHLANVANDVPDVHNAVAIVAGPYAVVGIDVDKNLERQEVGTVKFSVSEALKNDPYGKTAVVVADADATERLRNMRKRIQDGEPIFGIVDELAEVVGRYMPTFPVEQERNEDINGEDGIIDESENQEPSFDDEHPNDR